MRQQHHGVTICRLKMNVRSFIDSVFLICFQGYSVDNSDLDARKEAILSCSDYRKLQDLALEVERTLFDWVVISVV